MKVHLGLALVFVVLVAVLQTAGPVALKSLINGVSSAEPGTLLLLTVKYALLIGGAQACQSTVLWLNGLIWRRAQHSLWVVIYGHVIELNHEQHLERKTGEFTRIVNDGFAGFRSVVGGLFFGVMPVILQLVGVLAVFFSLYDPFLAIAMVAFAFLYGLVFLISNSKERAGRGPAAAMDAKALGVATDALLNHEIVKLLTAEPVVISQLERALEEGDRSWKGVYRTRCAGSLILNAIVAVALLIMLGGGVFATRYGGMTSGDFVMITSFLFLIIGPIERAAYAVRECLQGWSYLSALAPIFNEPSEYQSAAGTIKLARTEPLQVAFEDVWFGYDAARPVLKGVTFHISKGETVAIVGSSGAGKSTVSRLLSRLYLPQKGRIWMDGARIEDLDLRDLRRAVSVVPQDTSILNDTIENNILLARPDASKGDLLEAVRCAGLIETIERLPSKWQTTLGERGLKLSGGERQRVALARSFLRRPRLLILDEATSSLDTELERQVMGALQGSTTEATVLIIAHRLSTVVDAAKIFVLSEGKIVEQGNHECLMARGGRYASLWKAQKIASSEMAQNA